VEGDYVRKPITDNFGMGFFHDDENTLCICVHHKPGKDFSPTQKKVIHEVFARPEFTACCSEALAGTSPDDERSEISVNVKTKAFGDWDNVRIADWVVRLFDHFVNTVTLLELT
jgi:hypothetical protein